MDQTENQAPKRNFFGSFSAGALFVWDFLKIILIALVIILPIRYFVFQPFIVEGSSMEPNYQTNQYLIIDELSYHFSNPKRGDVVVLHPPNRPKEYYIKRIIGLPGEKVKIADGHVTIINDKHPNGVTVNESYLPNPDVTGPHDQLIVGGNRILTLKTNEYFMMGDNRPASSDSRDWGVLQRNEMIGKVFLRILPLTEFNLAHRPSYNL